MLAFRILEPPGERKLEIGVHLPLCGWMVGSVGAGCPCQLIGKSRLCARHGFMAKALVEEAGQREHATWSDVGCMVCGKGRGAPPCRKRVDCSFPRMFGNGDSLNSCYHRNARRKHSAQALTSASQQRTQGLGRQGGKIWEER